MTGECRKNHDLQPQMPQPGARLALMGPLIKQLSGLLPGEPENKLLLEAGHCGLEQPFLVLVCPAGPTGMGKDHCCWQLSLQIRACCSMPCHFAPPFTWLLLKLFACNIKAQGHVQPSNHVRRMQTRKIN